MNAETNSIPTTHSLTDSLIHRSVDNADASLKMSSLEIAELAGKQHKNVLADIRKMLESLGIQPAEFSARYKDAKNEDRDCFNLPKRETLILVSGYFTEVRAKIIDRWMELEGAARALTPAEANLANAKLMVAIERRQFAIEIRQSEQDSKIEDAGRRLNQIETATDHFTAIGYARWVKHTSIDYKTAAEIGRHASRRAKHLGIKLTKIPDPRFGAVSQYPKSVLDFAWDEVFGAAQ